MGSRSTSVIAPGSSAASKLVSGDSTRTFLRLTNRGSVIVDVGHSPTMSYGDGTLLYPNTFQEFEDVQNAFYGRTASGTGSINVEEIVGGGTSRTGRLLTTGIANSVAANRVGMSDGTNIVEGNVPIVELTSAITPNSTTTTESAGTIVVTSHATGRGQIYVSDGSKLQLMTSYTDREAQTTRQTIATSGATSFYAIAPQTGIIESIDFVGIDALAQHASNYLTFTGLNLGQSGVGSTAVLAVSDANTTKTSTGSAITAKARRQITLHGTAANLVVTKGDVIELTATASGTPANTVSGNFQVRVTRTA